MKTFILAATTADGFIGHDASHLSTRWTSAADKTFFTRVTKEAGVVVMGRSTFDTIGHALPSRRTIVLTSRPLEVEGVESTNELPSALFERLKNESVSAVAICGGASVYAQCMAANLVDEVYLTVHPVFFGTGVRLFSQPLATKLNLLETKDLGDATVMLHYAVTPEAE